MLRRNSNENFIRSVDTLKRILLSKQKRPDLILTNDDYAQAVYAAIADCGLRIPDDLAVIGMDNLRSGLCMRPELSTFDIDSKAGLAFLVDSLCRRIEDPGRPYGHMVMKMKYISRKSC